MTKDELKDIEEKDDGSSLEKCIEELNKEDPNYDTKRDELLKLITECKEQIKKLQDETRSQQKAVVNTLKMLRSEQEKNPDNPELEKLVIATELDAQFLTRARIETFAHNQEINEKSKILSASKAFNTPALDTIKVPTDIRLKPLPSDQVESKREKAKEVPNQKQRDQKVGKKINNLRQTRVKNRIVPRSNTPNQRS